MNTPYICAKDIYHTWLISAPLDCCGVMEHSLLQTADRLPSWRYEEPLGGEFDRFVDAFLYYLHTRERPYLHVIADKQGGCWDRYLFSKLGKRMKLTLADGREVFFKCSFSGWTRNPNTGNQIQLVTIIEER